MTDIRKPRFHRQVQQDLFSALETFEQKASSKVADAFYDLFLEEIEKACRFPERNHLTTNGYRRCNLTRFRYHFLYRVHQSEIRIQVLKHDLRHPSYGLRRQF